ncbi:MAG: hypothetical protein COB78_03475 [Hyphomicrobiales bacterium]|nr:MAG: hypothetical protein COB78_03475 [Hyphomicrobiales bacterium]
MTENGSGPSDTQCRHVDINCPIIFLNSKFGITPPRPFSKIAITQLKMPRTYRVTSIAVFRQEFKF